MSEIDFKFRKCVNRSNSAKDMPLNAILVVTKRCPKPCKFPTNVCDLNSVSQSWEHAILNSCVPIFST